MVGQICLVVPSRDTVIVRMGHPAGTAQYHTDIYHNGVFGAILAAPGGAA